MNTNKSTVLPIAYPRFKIRKRNPLPFREALALWFALSSPLIGVIFGFIGAWFVTWLTT